MKNSVGSFIALNRRFFLLFGIVLSLAVLGFAGWGSIRQFGGQIAAIISGDSGKVESDTSKRKEADNPGGRASWFMYQRMYPFNKVPDNARRSAFEEVIARGEGLGPAGAGATWTSIGPVPTAGAGPGGAVSGRINEIAISPANTQIILVAGSTGGIWRSANGGTNFVPVSDSQVDVAVGAIAFAPSDPNIVYAGMGDNDNGYFGTGVLKSTDAGATWTRINNNSLPDRAQSTSIHVDPANPNKVYLAQFNSLDAANCTSRPCDGVIGGVYVSTDGGVRWTRTLTGQASDLAIHPTNPQIIYAALRFGGAAADPRGLFKSTDGGTTWNNVFASPFNAEQDSTKDFRVAVTAASPDLVYIYFGTDGPPVQVRLEMSEDAGATFTNRGAVGTSATGLDPGQFGYNTYLEANPAEANTVWVGSRDFFRSTDGGVTFTNLNNSFRPPYTCGGCFTETNQKIHTDQQCFAFMPGAPNTFFAGNDGGIFKTTDSGATFTSLNASLSLVQFVSIALHPTDAARTYGGAQDNGSQRRTVGSNGWAEFVGGDGGKVAINPLDTTMVFPSNTNGDISRVLNNGTTNTATISNAATFGATQSTPRIEFYPPVVSNGVDARVYSGSWRLFICSDCNDPSRELGTANAPTWTAPGGMTDLTAGGRDVLTSIAVARSDNNVIYTGSRDGRAMRSTDGGVSWTNISTGLPTRTITNITVSVTDPTKVYLTVSGYGSGHVFSSTDGGTTWANISNGVPDIPTSAFLIDPLTATTLYAGTDIGVFRSTDSGGSWAAFNNGLPPTPVMAFSAQATGRIQLSTYGRGAYELGAGTPAPTPTPTPTPTPAVNVADATAQERGESGLNGRPSGEGTVDFTISLSAPSSQTVTVRVSTNGITATEGGDFIAVDDLDVVFPPNTLTRTVSVPTIEDPGDEPDETFSLDVTNVTNATVGDGQGIGTIIDDDPPSTTTRTIRAVSVGTQPGQVVTVPFQIDSQGNESSASFTVNFNPARLSNPVVALGNGVPAGSNLGTNINQVAAGRIGILVDSTNTYAAGTRQMITIAFNVAANAPIGLTPITFGSTPTGQSVSSAAGALLPTTYQAGSVAIGSTAAGVEVSGRVLTPDGRGLRNAQVSITDSNGNRRTATTSSFGYYRFEDVEVGSSFVIGVSARRYHFASRILQVIDNLADIDFVGLE